MNHGNEYVNVYSFRKLCKTKFSVPTFAEQWTFTSCCVSWLTPNAENRFRLGCGSLCLLRKTSDLGRGGFLGRIITRDSSRMSSSKSLLSDDTDNCLCTWPWCSVEFQSVIQEQRRASRTINWWSVFPRRAHFAVSAGNKHILSLRSETGFTCRTHVHDSKSSWIAILHFYSPKC